METPSIPQLTDEMQLVLQRGDSPRAIAISDQLFGALPEDPPVRLLRRTSLHQPGSSSCSWGDVPGDAVELQTRLSTAWAILGLAQFSLHRFQDADGSLRRALSADPNNPFALATMAVLLHQRRQDDKAIAVTRLLEDTPGASELIDEIRQKAQQRQFAREIVERNAYLEPQRVPGFSIWVWLTVWLVVSAVVLLVFQPSSPLGYVLGTAAPLVFVLLLRKLFS